jgi:hypothetical protein
MLLVGRATVVQAMSGNINDSFMDLQHSQTFFMAAIQRLAYPHPT